MPHLPPSCGDHSPGAHPQAPRTSGDAMTDIQFILYTIGMLVFLVMMYRAANT